MGLGLRPLRPPIHSPRPLSQKSKLFFPDARALQAALVDAPEQGAHEMQIQNGWGHFIAFCKCAARCDALDCNSEVGQYIRQILLEGAMHSSPAFDEKQAEDFDSHPSWGSPSPRIDAAAGLMFLAFKPTCNNADVLQEITRLGSDPVPAVRLQIADHLGVLGKTAPESFKVLLSEMAANDPSSTVVLSLLNRQIHRIAPDSPEDAERLATVIFRRTDLKGGNGQRSAVSLHFIVLGSFSCGGMPTLAKS